MGLPQTLRSSLRIAQSHAAVTMPWVITPGTVRSFPTSRRCAWALRGFPQFGYLAKHAKKRASHSIWLYVDVLPRSGNNLHPRNATVCPRSEPRMTDGRILFGTPKLPSTATAFDPFLVLNFRLDLSNRFAGFHFQSDGFPSQCFDKDLHDRSELPRVFTSNHQVLFPPTSTTTAYGQNYKPPTG